MFRSFRLLSLTALLTLPTSASEVRAQQASWQPLPGTSPAGRRAAGAAYDAGRQRLVLFGGISSVQLADTWEWDGTEWERRDTAVAPSLRYYGALAYDEARGRVVLFGGLDAQTVLGDTWEWDGQHWREVATPTRPAARYSHSLTWDPARGTLLMYGGSLGFSGAQSGELWEYDGADWTRIDTPSGPPPRAGHGAAVDVARSRLVVYAGFGDGNRYDDVWEWDGSTWSDVTPAVMPPRRGAPLVYDPSGQRTLMYGGSAGLTQHREDTWAWNGSSWTRLTTSSSAGPRSDHAMVFDTARGEALVVGGLLGAFRRYTSSIASFDGSMWTPRSDHLPVTLDTNVAFDLDSGRPIAFGGQVGLFNNTDDTFTYIADADGGRWQRVPVNGPRPAATTNHRLVTDPARGEVVLVGGDSSGALRDTTWVWDDGRWHDRTPIDGSQLPGRLRPAVAFDAGREVVVLHGGSPGGLAIPLDETWEWDGHEWRQLQPSTTPGPRYDASLAYDPIRGVCVLFGGSRSALGVARTDETWEFDGVDWRQVTPPTSPPARIGGSMVWDPVRQRVVLHGAAASLRPTVDAWEYDGTTWTEIAAAALPAYARLVFDQAQGRTLGLADGAETWTYATPTPPGRSRFGSACFGLGVAVEPDSWPVPGRLLRFAVTGVRPSWPVFLLFGESRSTAFGGPLPLDLTPAGLPGCTLLQSSDIALFSGLAGGAGRATPVYQVPTDPALLGSVLYVQAAAPSNSAPGLGWGLSAALSLVFGH